MMRTIDFAEMISKAWSARWKILALQVVLAVGCLMALLLLPRSYRSEARLFLQLGRESLGVDPTATTGQTIGMSASGREDEIASAMDVIRSRGLITKVVEDLGADAVLGRSSEGGVGSESSVGKELTRLPSAVLSPVFNALQSIDPMSDFERAVLLISKGLFVDAERKSEVIVIAYQAKSPELAQRVVEAIVRKYRDEHLRLHRTDGSKTFFDEQQELLASELSDVKERLKAAKNRMGIASIQGEREILESRRKDIVQGLSEANRSRKELTGKSISLQRELELTPARINSQQVLKANAATEAQETQLFELQLLESEYNAKYSADNPKLIAIREQVKEAESRYNEKSKGSSENTDDVNPIHRDLKLELIRNEALLAGLEDKESALRSEEIEVASRIERLNSHEIEIDDLEREANLRERKYIAYAESFEQARIRQALETERISSIVVAQHATLEEKPVSPSKLAIILFGLASMVSGAAGIALFCVQWDDRLITPTSARRRLGIPVLATITESRHLGVTNHP
ncbi:MAG: GumC family protein [Pirellula sp.]